MKKFFAPFLLLFNASIIVHAASSLDIGSEYRFRAVVVNNPSYTSETPIGSGKTINQEYYSERARVYVQGNLDSGIEIRVLLQSLGVAGSTAPVLNRYPHEEFTPFLENAYVKANQIGGTPFTITIGRQPFQWATGMLVDDDGLGLDGVHLEAGPFWNIKTDLFNSKAKGRFSEGDMDLYLAGLSSQWGIHKFQFAWVMENDHSGTPYSNLIDTTPVLSDQIQRQFYDFHLHAFLEKGAFYNFEYALQTGFARTFTKNVNLTGSALKFEGGFDFIHPRYKRMVLAFVFMQGSGGNSSDSTVDGRFNPSFNHRFDGLEKGGYGEFFGATPNGFFNEDKAIIQTQVGGTVVGTRPYDTLFSGIRMYGFRGSVSPWSSFTAGFEYYLFSALQQSTIGIGGGAGTDLSLGRELVLKTEYRYSPYLTFGIRWGKFSPGTNLNSVESSRLIFEASGRF